jgi:uncharacterized membrane protein YoaK (UPF0700 family)
VSEHIKLTYVETILLLTAFAASAVDVIGFADLGRVFASAMTGNFALLAYHTAQGDWQSAIGSVIALGGFVAGCSIGFLQRRGRPEQEALGRLLASETVLLLLFAACSLAAPRLTVSIPDHLQIALLAVAMGLQAVIGRIISLTTIVFTTTLTRLVGNAVDVVLGQRGGMRDIKIQSAVVMCYLCGAFLSGVLVIRQVPAVVLMPLAGIALALATQRRGELKAAAG